MVMMEWTKEREETHILDEVSLLGLPYSGRLSNILQGTLYVLKRRGPYIYHSTKQEQQPQQQQHGTRGPSSAYLCLVAVASCTSDQHSNCATRYNDRAKRAGPVTDGKWLILSNSMPCSTASHDIPNADFTAGADGAARKIHETCFYTRRVESKWLPIDVRDTRLVLHRALTEIRSSVERRGHPYSFVSFLFLSYPRLLLTYDLFSFFMLLVVYWQKPIGIGKRESMLTRSSDTGKCVYSQHSSIYVGAPFLRSHIQTIQDDTCPRYVAGAWMGFLTDDYLLRENIGVICLGFCEESIVKGWH